MKKYTKNRNSFNYNQIFYAIISIVFGMFVLYNLIHYLIFDATGNFNINRYRFVWYGEFWRLTMWTYPIVAILTGVSIFKKYKIGNSLSFLITGNVVYCIYVLFSYERLTFDPTSKLIYPFLFIIFTLYYIMIETIKFVKLNSLFLKRLGVSGIFVIFHFINIYLLNIFDKFNYSVFFK